MLILRLQLLPEEIPFTYPPDKRKTPLSLCLMPTILWKAPKMFLFSTTHKADFTPNPQQTVLEEANIAFANHSTGIESFSSLWRFGDGDSSNLANPTHTYTATGTYEVLLHVSSAFGCANDITKEVLPDFAAYAPNSFTPNGNGLNDKFEIKGVGIKKFKLQIYSRWGELIFESDNIENQWDGTYNGQLVPRGTYVYHVYYTTFLDERLEEEGTVTVIH